MPTRWKPTRVLALGILLALCAGAVSSHGQETQRRTLGGGAQGSKQGLGARNCLGGGCHKDFAGKYLGMKNVHAVVRENTCDQCHLRHGLVAKRVMKKDGNDLCYSCHPKDKVGLNEAHVHTAVKTGACVLCHNPHASNAPHLLAAEPTQVCYQCHDQADYEQKVVHKVLQTDGCLACHSSHGAAQPNLLVKEEKALCLGCHAASAPAFKDAHGGYPVDQASCSGCHSPHSSAQPGLLKTSVHAPVAGSQCDTCHVAPASAKPFAVNQAGGALCAACHEAAAMKGAGKVQHLPFKDGECVLCHAPHASANPKLLTGKGNELCATCHKSRAAPVSFGHAPVAGPQGCLACHGAHSADHERLLTAEAGALCLSCHAATKEAVQKSKTPHAPAAADECTACHDPHGSERQGHPEGARRSRLLRLPRRCRDEVHQDLHARAGPGWGVRVLPSSARLRRSRAAQDRGREALRVLSRGLHEADRRGRQARALRRGHVPELPRSARQQHQGHGARQRSARCVRRATPTSRTGWRQPGRSTRRSSTGECAACHNPHQAALKGLLLAKNTDLCLGCHATLKAALAEGRPHSPAARDCLRCHQPHSSGENRLMVKPVRTLCADCHDPGTAAFSEAHLDIDPARIRCERCHDAHASKAPGLFKSSVHAPFAMKSCQDCHLPRVKK